MNRAEREAFLEQKFKEMRHYEDALYAQGVRYIAGVDEVGRGPLAGPVVAAAVVLPADFYLPGIDDSKKLTEKKREELFDPIMSQALAVGIGVVDNRIIDTINILEATKKAMKAAIDEAAVSLYHKKGEKIQHVLLDALTLKDVEIPQTGIIKGDTSCILIAAASIIAKVSRDRMMVEYHKEYPHYSFDKNKGYATKAHYDGITACGTCAIHRQSFLRNVETTFLKLG